MKNRLSSCSKRAQGGQEIQIAVGLLVGVAAAMQRFLVVACKLSIFMRYVQ